MKDYYLIKKQEILDEFNVNESGYSSERAKDILLEKVLEFNRRQYFLSGL